jgi:hypothetical protein
MFTPNQVQDLVDHFGGVRAASRATGVPRTTLLGCLEPEVWRENNRRWRENNPEKSRASSRRWYKKNPEKARERNRLYREENREAVRARTRISARNWYWRKRVKALGLDINDYPEWQLKNRRAP